MNKVIINKTQIEEAGKLYDEMARNFWPIVGTANHMAMSSMFDCYDLLESQGMLRFEIKKDMNNAARVYDKYLLPSRPMIISASHRHSPSTRPASDTKYPQFSDLRSNGLMETVRHVHSVSTSY